MYIDVNDTVQLILLIALAVVSISCYYWRKEALRAKKWEHRWQATNYDTQRKLNDLLQK